MTKQFESLKTGTTYFLVITNKSGEEISNRAFNFMGETDEEVHFKRDPAYSDFKEDILDTTVLEKFRFTGQVMRLSDHKQSTDKIIRIQQRECVLEYSVRIDEDYVLSIYTSVDRTDIGRLQDKSGQHFWLCQYSEPFNQNSALLHATLQDGDADIEVSYENVDALIDLLQKFKTINSDTPENLPVTIQPKALLEFFYIGDTYLLLSAKNQIPTTAILESIEGNRLYFRTTGAHSAPVVITVGDVEPLDALHRRKAFSKEWEIVAQLHSGISIFREYEVTTTPQLRKAPDIKGGDGWRLILTVTAPNNRIVEYCPTVSELLYQVERLQKRMMVPQYLYNIELKKSPRGLPFIANLHHQEANAFVDMVDAHRAELGRW